MALNRSQILSAKDLPIEEVAVPEWGGTVFVRGMNGAERDAFELSVVDQKQRGRLDLSNVRAKLCALTICDEKGERVFSEKDVEALAKKSATALSRVFIVAQRMSGMSEEDAKEIRQDFLSGQNGASISG